MDKETIGAERLRTDTESIKLFKMTKNYNWEIKILSTDIERLEKLDIEMHKRFDTFEG